MNAPSHQPFVGTAAFAHKGGMHVHAVRRAARSYEHVEPKTVGNTRRFLVSELSGVSNIAEVLGDKFDFAADRDVQRRLLQRVQELENQGYQFEAATASFELLLHELVDKRPTHWRLDHYRCVILKTGDEGSVTEAIVKLSVGDTFEHNVADGDGPVNALDGALRKCLVRHYPQIDDVHLRDFRVRVVNPTAESAAKVRVNADFVVQGGEDGGESDYFATIGVNENIVDASWQALTDAFMYHLMKLGVVAK
jgi:2-isopropylmalate synthase